MGISYLSSVSQMVNRYEHNRPEVERDRHRGEHKDRDWSDRDHKKTRHE